MRSMQDICKDRGGRVQTANTGRGIVVPERFLQSFSKTCCMKMC